MKIDNLKKNLGYQTVYQIISIIVPIFTAPYVSRVLGASNLGDFSYTSSIVSYFTIFAMLATSTYGTKEIAAVRGDREKTSKTFWEIYIFQGVICSLILLLYLIMCFTIGRDYKLFFLCQTFTIVGCILDISWLYFGLEEFKKTVGRNLAAKVFSLVCIFSFVHRPEDIYKYVLFMSLANGLGNVLFWPTIRKYVDYKAVSYKNIVRRIKPNLVLFIPVIATSIYHEMDKTMLGYFSDSFQSGYYYNAHKMMNIPLSVVTGVSTVLLARMSSIAQKAESSKRQADSFLNIGMVMLCPIAFGLGTVAPIFCPVFFGPGYDECVIVLQILCVAMIFKGVSAIVRSIYLIPFSLNSVYIRAVVSGAVLNLFANYYFIKILNIGARGAAYGTVIAEVIVCLIQIAGVIQYGKRTQIKFFDRKNWLALYSIASATVMSLCIYVFALNIHIPSQFVYLVVQILIGVVVYIGLIIIPVLVRKKQKKI